MLSKEMKTNAAIEVVSALKTIEESKVQSEKSSIRSTIGRSI